MTVPNSRAVIELQNLRKSLEKLISNSDNGNSEEAITDVLTAIQKVPINIEILRESQIGSVLQETRSKFAEGNIGKLAKRILIQWKKDCSVAADKSTSVDEATASSMKTSDNAQPTKKSNDPNDAPDPPTIAKVASISEDDYWADDHDAQLSNTRRKILETLTEALKLSAKDSIAKFIAQNIECSLNALHPEHVDAKPYIAKAKSLSYNLKSNEVRRKNLISPSGK